MMLFRYRLSLFGLFQAQGVIKSTLKYFDNRFLYSDLQRSLHSAGHRSWQKRQPAPQSKLRKLRQRACSACFVPVMQKMQINLLFPLSQNSVLLRSDFFKVVETKKESAIKPTLVLVGCPMGFEPMTFRTTI